MAEVTIIFTNGWLCRACGRFGLAPAVHDPYPRGVKRFDCWGTKSREDHVLSSEHRAAVLARFPSLPKELIGEVCRLQCSAGDIEIYTLTRLNGGYSSSSGERVFGLNS